MQRSAKLLAGATAGAVFVSGVALAGIAYTKASPREPGGSRIVRQRVGITRVLREDPAGRLPERDRQAEGP